MASPWFRVVEGALSSGLELILPVSGQKVKGVSPSPLEVLLRSIEEEPTKTTDSSTIAPGFRHDLNTYAVIDIANEAGDRPLPITSSVAKNPIPPSQYLVTVIILLDSCF